MVSKKSFNFNVFIYLLMVFNSLISILNYYMNDLNQIYSSWFYLSFFIFLGVLYVNRSNILFFMRTFFLGIIGILVYATKVVSLDAGFGFHFRESQTVYISSIIFIMSNIALLFNQIGWDFSQKIKISKNKASYEYTYLFYLVLILQLILSYFEGIAKGGLFSYGGGESLPLGNINSIANILFFVLIHQYYKKYQYYKNQKLYLSFILFAGFYLYFWNEFFRGARIDALSGLIGVYIIYNIYNNKSLALDKIKVFVGFFAFMLSQIIGTVRGIIDKVSIDIIWNGIKVIWSGRVDYNILFYQGTINDIATTMSGIIFLIQEKLIELKYGLTYFEYILRIPPKFIFPDRPDAYSRIFFDYGYTSGGGFFELAEAYFNFGIFGAMIVPFVLALFIGFAFRYFVDNKYSLIHSIVFFGLLSQLLRFMLYQNFVLFKSIITAFIIVFMLKVVNSVFKINYQSKKQRHD